MSRSCLSQHRSHALGLYRPAPQGVPNIDCSVSRNRVFQNTGPRFISASLEVGPNMEGAMSRNFTSKNIFPRLLPASPEGGAEHGGRSV